MDPKQGLVKKGNGENMSKWSLPQPNIKPDSSPAKPQGGGTSGGKYASKTANTHSGTGDMVSSIKSRY